FRPVVVGANHPLRSIIRLRAVEGRGCEEHRSTVLLGFGIHAEVQCERQGSAAHGAQWAKVIVKPRVSWKQGTQSSDRIGRRKLQRRVISGVPVMLLIAPEEECLVLANGSA